MEEETLLRVKPKIFNSLCQYNMVIMIICVVQFPSLVMIDHAFHAHAYPCRRIKFRSGRLYRARDRGQLVYIYVYITSSIRNIKRVCKDAHMLIDVIELLYMIYTSTAALASPAPGTSNRSNVRRTELDFDHCSSRSSSSSNGALNGMSTSSI